MIVSLLSALHTVAIIGLSLFGFWGLLTLWFHFRNRRTSLPTPPVSEAVLPSVTVQLPLYNERFVVSRLIEAAANLNYPPHKLQIQVVDDSDDDTTDLVMEQVREHRRRGLNISMEHRPRRVGFKAGALQAALERASGQYIAVFDADFVPEPDFLRQTIPHFMNEPGLGMIQTRWGHINSLASPLTAAQTIILDTHFAVEQTARHQANLFPKFNGSAGIWRRQCLEDSGGWHTDTVCEDLCLSTRAILSGWHFLFLNDVVAPAQLPATVSAFKNQQARWAKGSTQCLFKFAKRVLTASKHSAISRLYALLSMGAYFVHPFLLLLLLVQVPLIAFSETPSVHPALVAVLGLGQPLLLIIGQRSLYGDWLRRLRYLPFILVAVIGLAPVNSRSVLEATFSRRHTFVRTPKVPTVAGSPPMGYGLPFDWIVLVEIGVALYAAVGLAICIRQANFGPVIFLTACLAGTGYVALSSLRDRFVPAAAITTEPV